jgi:hypothetical protein
LSKLDEIYRLHRLLDGRRSGISRTDLIGEHGFARSTLARLIANLEPGLLDDHLRPLQTRIDQLLASQHLGAGEAAQRIRLLSIASRHKNPRHFQAVAHAVLQRQVFPAHAGMNRGWCGSTVSPVYIPRSRGALAQRLKNVTPTRSSPGVCR